MIRYPLVLPFNPVTYTTNGLVPKERGKKKNKYDRVYRLKKNWKIKKPVKVFKKIGK